MNYWNDKVRRLELAKSHTQEMDCRYANEIIKCAEHSRIYGVNAMQPAPAQRSGGQAVSKVMKDTTDGALAKLPDDGKKTALLNFASYKNPGGMFLAGSMAQEEALCHVSFLYNVLAKLAPYYEWNRKNLNKALYKDRAIYTPDVLFTECMRKADVITCAAPNRSVLEKYGSFTEEENSEVLKDRVDFVRDIAVQEGAERMILGAWGCGVFRQDPETVALLFKKAFAGTGVECIYAVPDNKTYNIFKKVIERR